MKSLRVLTVTTSEKRLSNLKLVTESAGGRELFWSSTFDQATAESVSTDPIWQVAGEGGLKCLLVDQS